MAQQTAVEWLIEQLEQQVYTIDHKDNRVIPKSFDDIIEIKKQAKQMEKKQIKIAYNDGADHMVESKYEGMDNYYKLRYGSDN